METLDITVGVQGLGKSIQKTYRRTADGGEVASPTIPHGYNGTLTTRTDNNTGTITLAGGHGITTGMIVYIYFAAGIQFSVTVGTVSTNSMPFDLGQGTNLPIATTAVIVSPVVTVAITVSEGFSTLFLFAKYDDQTEASTCKYLAIADAETIGGGVLPANVPWVYDIASGIGFSPYTFDGNSVDTLKVSNGSAVNDAEFDVIVLQDISS